MRNSQEGQKGEKEYVCEHNMDHMNEGAKSSRTATAFSRSYVRRKERRKKMFAFVVK